MPQATVLVVDNDPAQRKLIQQVLETKLGFHTVAAGGSQEAINYIAGRHVPVPEVVLLDLSTPGGEGIKVIETLRPLFPHLPIIALTVYGETEKAMVAMKAGATDFLSRPVAHERLRASVINALRINRLSNEVQRLLRTQAGQVTFEDIIGESESLMAAKNRGMCAANLDIPVLLEGEAGAGKALFARAIHGFGARAGTPFVTVNCREIPETLAENILFGQESGAIADASYRSLSKFREAEGGTVFLHNIEELSPLMQAKLLQRLQRKEIAPSGREVRVMASSHIDLSRAVRVGRFREDLYRQLNHYPLRVPPLRERRKDIGALAGHFLDRFAARENRALRYIAPQALAVMEQYSWPGNIRQLENTVFRAVVMAEGEGLEYSLLQSLLPESLHVEDDTRPKRLGMMRTRQLPLLNESGDIRRIRDLEEDAIYYALQRYDGRISEVARKLGIGRSTLYRKISEFGIPMAS